MTNRKTGGGSWRALLFGAAVPAALALALAAVVALLSCCEAPPPDQWIGMDRAKVSCANDDETYLHRQKTCVGYGRAYKCVSDDSHVWRCAEVGVSRPPAEAPAGGRL